MRYYLKEEKKEELLFGRTITALAEMVGISRTQLTLIFNGKECKKYIAMSLISIRNNIAITDEKMNELLLYYFNIK